MSEQPTRGGLDPQLLFGISLLSGLALSWPSLSAAMHGNADIIAAGIRLLLSIAVVWAGIFLVSSLIGGYARANELHDDGTNEDANAPGADSHINNRAGFQVAGDGRVPMSGDPSDSVTNTA